MNSLSAALGGLNWGAAEAGGGETGRAACGAAVGAAVAAGAAGAVGAGDAGGVFQGSGA